MSGISKVEKERLARFIKAVREGKILKTSIHSDAPTLEGTPKEQKPDERQGEI